MQKSTLYLFVLLAVLAPLAGATEDCAADVFGAGGGCVAVNSATAAELATLYRIGPALAARIVEDRETNGPYSSMLDLERVRGIGGATVCLNQRAVTFKGSTTRTTKYRPEDKVVESCKGNPTAGNCIDC